MTTRVLPRLQPPDTSYWSILRLSLPIWISNLAIVGGATIDTLMTGHLGAQDLAGVAIGLAVTVSVFIALVGVMQGLSPIAGHHFGAANINESAMSFIRPFGSLCVSRSLRSR